MENTEPLIERLGTGEGHLCVDGWSSPRLWEHQGGVQLAILDLPTAAHTVLQARAGADDWLHNRASLTFTLHHSRMDGPQEALLTLRETLLRVRDLLAERAAVYVFADPRLSAQARLLCDEVFGRGAFRNEIVWAHGSGKRPRGHFTRVHDTILFYAKGAGIFNPEASGRRRGAEPTNHMRRSVDAQGRVYFARVKGGRELRYFEDDIVSLGDVWTDIPELTPRDAERIGWEGQRPEALIERIVRSSSHAGGIVLDACSGAGTVAAAAHKAGRRAVAVAEGPFERLLFRRRVLEAGAGDYTIEHPALTSDSAQASVRFAGGLAYLPELTPGAGQGSLLDDGGTLDGWLAGLLRANEFTVSGVSMRTRGNPALRLSLPLGEGEGTPAALLCDAGAQTKLVVGRQ